MCQYVLVIQFYLFIYQYFFFFWLSLQFTEELQPNSACYNLLLKMWFEIWQQDLLFEFIINETINDLIKMK